MKGKFKKKNPEIIFREGKPTAVILDINEYREMLEKLEDIEDLKILTEMRKKPLKFKSLNDFLKEHPSRVSSSS
jgi:PHD/YefM family antitoxin component YafN of YafNO toxin-antitoxin module